MNAHYDDIYRVWEDTPLQNESEWAMANKKAKVLYDMSQGPLNGSDFFVLVHDFYNKLQKRDVERLTESIEERVEKLKRDIGDALRADAAPMNAPTPPSA